MSTLITLDCVQYFVLFTVLQLEQISSYTHAKKHNQNTQLEHYACNKQIVAHCLFNLNLTTVRIPTSDWEQPVITNHEKKGI